MEAPSELAAYPELEGFRLIQELGRSPKGIVYKARRLVEQDIVAVKVFKEHAHLDANFRANLPRNAENTFLLEHAGIVRCLGCQEDKNRLLLVMEYARGEPLSRALQRNVRFLPPRALSIGLQIADALHYAYQRHRYHGRLHPGDVILGEEDVRVLNIGLGERFEHPDWTVHDPHLFAPLTYAPLEAMPTKALPEAEHARRAIDLYGLGALLYHMLTGSPPFRGNDEGAIMAERESIAPAVVRWPKGAEKTLPSRSVALVERLLSPDPGHRGVYESVLASLDEALRESEGRPPVIHRMQAAPPPVLAPVEIAPRPVPEAPHGEA
ncbi:MAG: protein kinase, partial [Planctomycetota bacterium]|nr:protein kinase [Planctomycetota bacterium]